MNSFLALQNEQNRSDSNGLILVSISHDQFRYKIWKAYKPKYWVSPMDDNLDSNADSWFLKPKCLCFLCKQSKLLVVSQLKNWTLRPQGNHCLSIQHFQNALGPHKDV